jgi:hypothetical protein
VSGKRLYTPQLHEKNIRKLYRIAKRQGIPMTKLLNLIVCTAVEELERAPELLRRRSKCEPPCTRPIS